MRFAIRANDPNDLLRRRTTVARLRFNLAKQFFERRLPSILGQLRQEIFLKRLSCINRSVTHHAMYVIGNVLDLNAGHAMSVAPNWRHSSHIGAAEPWGGTRLLQPGSVSTVGARASAKSREPGSGPSSARTASVIEERVSLQVVTLHETICPLDSQALLLD